MPSCFELGPTKCIADIDSTRSQVMPLQVLSKATFWKLPGHNGSCSLFIMKASNGLLILLLKIKTKNNDQLHGLGPLNVIQRCITSHFLGDLAQTDLEISPVLGASSPLTFKTPSLEVFI